VLSSSADILVLGAGLQGSCVALALAAAGHRPVVVDRASAPMTGASRTNEGKIHLGILFALDSTLRTQRTMLRGALSFAPLLDRWLGPQPWVEWRTDPISYAVMPGSLLSADQLETRYAAMTTAFDDVAASTSEVIGAPSHYLGEQLTGAIRRERGAPHVPRVAGVPVESFRTEERGIDPNRLADAVSAAVGTHPSIQLALDTEVVDAARDSDGFRVDVVTREGARTTISTPAVVNCLWDQRLAVDAHVGITSPVSAWTYRIKYQVVVQPEPSAVVEPVTMVQGPFGDVVPQRDGTVRLSWYPVCRTRRTSEPPTPSAPDTEALSRDTIAAMAAVLPALEGSRPVAVVGGVIVAPGRTDIDDPTSALHERANAAVHEHDGWWSIDTSKLTTAPLLAHETARRVGLRAGRHPERVEVDLDAGLGDGGARPGRPGLGHVRERGR
jgi:glycine/D-amino acid oxidase-like deaminating enzyme